MAEHDTEGRYLPIVLEGDDGLHPYVQTRANSLWPPRPPQVYNEVQKPEEKPRDVRRVIGLKPWMFWSLLVCVGLVTIAASVGGAIGGVNAVTSSSSPSSTPSPSASAAAAATNSSVSTSSALTTSSRSSSKSSTSTGASSTASNLDGCPGSNGTLYTPPNPQGAPGKYTFMKACNYRPEGNKLLSVFAADFNGCMDMCSTYSYMQSPGNCTSVIFLKFGTPPANCWGYDGSRLIPSVGDAGAMLVGG